MQLHLILEILKVMMLVIMEELGRPNKIALIKINFILLLVDINLIQKIFSFPTTDGGDTPNEAQTYGSNIGCFSAGYFQVIMQIPEEVGDTQSIYMKANVSNLKMTSETNIEVTEDKNSKDDSLNTSITLYPPGNYLKATELHSGDSDSSNINGSNSTALSPTYTGGESCMTVGEDIVIVATVAVDKNNDDKMKAVNVLQKFDDEAFIPVEGSNINSGMQQITGGQASTKGDLKVLYAAKPDRTGWNDDMEMQTTKRG